MTMLEKGREPLAVGRRKRRATKAQRRALLRRDGGCARPGCTETRIERLHVHHMRHWLFGGRTDLANLVLLCDSGPRPGPRARPRHEPPAGGRSSSSAPDGRRVWGAADAAFAGGLAGLDTNRPSSARADATTASDRRPRRPPDRRPGPAARVVGARDGRRPADDRDRSPTGRSRGRRGRRSPPVATTPSELSRRSAQLSSRPASHHCPTRCRSTANGWTSATSSACSWATATSFEAPAEPDPPQP